MTADEMQGFIDGIMARSETELISREEAMALALGRCATVLMEHAAELAAQADPDQDPAPSDVLAINSGLLATTYRGLMDVFLFLLDLASIAEQGRVVH